MIGVVYLGNNLKTQERLKYIPGQLVRMATNYKNAAQICTPHVSNEHFLVFYERNVLNEDITAITYLRKKCPNVYIILMTDTMTEEERNTYLKCGINDTIHFEASVTDLNKKIQFISDREYILFSSEAPWRGILKFKIPVWKRLFDIIVASLAIIVLSPIFILTAIAIKMESKGPVLFKSKRVGTNYAIFDFLKFRSMYADAEHQLKELSKEHNQYKEQASEESKSASTAPLDDQANLAMMNMGTDTEMMISDEEIMLVGDDFVVSETDFNKQKEEEINNAFVKIEDDPRVTKVGKFIRKFSIDELPQLFNILKGDMSLIGPRPPLTYHPWPIGQYTPHQRRMFEVRPGITGWAQVHGRKDVEWNHRIELSVWYVDHLSLALDVKIFFMTIWKVFSNADNENIGETVVSKDTTRV